jgi:hypothetical protein
VVRDAREHEQEIGQPVHIAQQDRIDWWIERHDAALGAAADRPRDVERGTGWRAAGQDEPPQRRQLVFHLVDQPLEPRHVVVRERGFRDPGGYPVRRIGELGAKGEEIALKLLQCRRELGVDRRGSGLDPARR